jgi:hypothetical protein
VVSSLGKSQYTLKLQPVVDFGCQNFSHLPIYTGYTHMNASEFYQASAAIFLVHDCCVRHCSFCGWNLTSLDDWMTDLGLPRRLPIGVANIALSDERELSTCSFQYVSE